MHGHGHTRHCDGHSRSGARNAMFSYKEHGSLLTPALRFGLMNSIHTAAGTSEHLVSLRQYLTASQGAGRADADGSRQDLFTPQDRHHSAAVKATADSVDTGRKLVGQGDSHCVRIDAGQWSLAGCDTAVDGQVLDQAVAGTCLCIG